MRDLNRCASLTAGLLIPASAGKRVDLCLVKSDSSTPDVNLHRVAAVKEPLLCAKGAASAGGFDPLLHTLAHRSSSYSAPMPLVRVWFRIDPSRRLKMKLAASDRKESCQGLLTRALDSFVLGCQSMPAPTATPAAKVATRQNSLGKRHKIAIWVSSEQRDRIHAAASFRRQTIQKLLMAALDAELKRIGGTAETGRCFLNPSADSIDDSTAAVSGAIVPSYGCSTLNQWIRSRVPAAA